MRRRFEPWFVILLVLIAIGLADTLFRGWQSFIIPIALVAIIYLLYKFPPNRWGRSSSAYRGSGGYRPGPSVRKSQPKSQPKQQRRPSPFRVIEGRKGNDDEPPRYH